MAPPAPTNAPRSAAATASCARCGKAFENRDDRRAQLRAPDLCRACHLDPRARALPLDSDLERGWIARCARTLVQLISSPSASFRLVDEPVLHGRTLAFLASLRLPLWFFAIAWAAATWALDDGGVPQLKLPNVIGDFMRDAQFAEVLRLWLLLLVPIGLPTLYLMGGILAHVGIALTGGARRSIGASMRAFGLALAPSLVLIGIADLLTVTIGVEPEVWLVLIGVAVLSASILLTVAMARTHSTTLARGLLVTLLPLTLFTGVSGARGLLEFSRMPFMEAPEIDKSFAPFPIH